MVKDKPTIFHLLSGVTGSVPGATSAVQPTNASGSGSALTDSLLFKSAVAALPGGSLVNAVASTNTGKAMIDSILGALGVGGQGNTPDEDGQVTTSNPPLAGQGPFPNDSTVLGAIFNSTIDTLKGAGSSIKNKGTALIDNLLSGLGLNILGGGDIIVRSAPTRLVSMSSFVDGDVSPDIGPQLFEALNTMLSGSAGWKDVSQSGNIPKMEGVINDTAKYLSAKMGGTTRGWNALIKSMIYYESSGKQNALNSTSGAFGYFQFLPSTAKGIQTQLGRALTADDAVQFAYFKTFIPAQVAMFDRIWEIKGPGEVTQIGGKSQDMLFRSFLQDMPFTGVDSLDVYLKALISHRLGALTPRGWTEDDLEKVEHEIISQRMISTLYQRMKNWRVVYA